MISAGRRRVFARTGLVAAGAAVLYATITSVGFVYRGLPRHRAEAAWFIASAIAFVVLALTPQAAAGFLDPPNGAQASWRHKGYVMVAFLFFSFLLYVPVLTSGLFSDDYVLLERASQGYVSMGTDFFRPLPLLIWRLAVTAGDFYPVLLHGLSLALHGVNSWLVYVLAAELGLSRRFAFLAGALFLTSAANVEAVVWVSALFDVLMVTGILLYCLTCLRGWLAGSIGALSIALLSKETSVVAPLLAMLAALAARRPLRLPLVGIVLTAVFVGVRVTLLPPPDTYLVEPSRYLLKELVSRAFGSLALPWTPADMKDLPFAAIFPWAAVAGLLLYRLTSGLPRPALANASMLLVWVIVSVLPVYSYFYVAPTLEGSRYLYLGTAAFSILIAQLAATRSAPGRESGGVIVLILIVGFSAIGVRRHQSAWLEAAAIRNAVLGAASDTLSTANCDSVAVKELPDSQNGAYVFRNGFAEALRAHGIQTPPLASESAACSYAWTGAQFTRER